eukprot:Ihof_evm2s291 gene=Ihof_evmTU2s291
MVVRQGTRKRKIQDGCSDTGSSMVSEYREGSIVRVALSRFVTYDSVEFRPGPNLNMIIGPNGNGKSTLVCAMCLGLGGQPKLLGRATKASDYIKYGEESCRIELELQKEGGNVIVERVITASNTSTWRINNCPAKEKDVAKIVEDFRIQFDNFCQFLPQDKVVEFARATEQVRLVQTEEAVGPPAMLLAHNQLIELQKRQANCGNDLSEKEATLSRLISLNRSLEPEVDSYHEIETLRREINLMKCKRKWIMYDDIRTELQVMKANKKGLMVQLDKLNKENLPVQRQIEEARANLNESQRKHDSKLSRGKLLDIDIKTKNEQLQELKDRCEEQKGRIATCQRVEREQTKKKKDNDISIASLMEKMEQLENQREGEDFETTLKDLLEKERECKARLREASNEMGRVRHDRENIENEVRQIQERLQGLDNKYNQRLEQIRRYSKDIYSAIQWIHNNKHCFDEEVFDPVIAVVNPTKTSYAKYIEHSIPTKIMFAFVVQTPHDQDILLRELSDAQKLKINVVLAPNPNDNFKPTRPLEDIASMGFIGYIKDLYTAPEPVKRMLCRECHHHSIPLGTAQTEAFMNQHERNADSLLYNMGLRSIFTEDSSVNIKQSKHGDRHFITTTMSVREARNMTSTVDTETKQRLEKELGEQRKKLREVEEAGREKEKEEKEIRGEQMRVTTHLNEMKERKKSLHRLQDDIKAKKGQGQYAEK